MRYHRHRVKKFICLCTKQFCIFKTDDSTKSLCLNIKVIFNLFGNINFICIYTLARTVYWYETRDSRDTLYTFMVQFQLRSEIADIIVKIIYVFFLKECFLYVRHRLLVRLMDWKKSCCEVVNYFTLVFFPLYIYIT